MSTKEGSRPIVALAMLWLYFAGMVIGQVDKGIWLNSKGKFSWLFVVVSIAGIALFLWIATLCYQAVRWA